MSQVIVPKGFGSVAHPIFSKFAPPVLLPLEFKAVEPSITASTVPADHADTDCPICLQKISDPITLIACEHFYCFTCIDSWFLLNLSCPLCKSEDITFIRGSMLDESGECDLYRLSVQLSSGSRGTVNSHEEERRFSAVVASHKKRCAQINNSVSKDIEVGEVPPKKKTKIKTEEDSLVEIIAMDRKEE